jgi:hypothetical protein
MSALWKLGFPARINEKCNEMSMKYLWSYSKDTVNTFQKGKQRNIRHWKRVFVNSTLQFGKTFARVILRIRVELQFTK